MINEQKMIGNLRAAGMEPKWAVTFTKRLLEDEREFPVTEEKRRWALERGFFPGRIELYGLTEDNWRNYLSDWHYNMLHPLNNHFLKWLDKTTLKYVLNSAGCEDTMPEYYIYIENDHHYTYLMDFPENIQKDEDVLLNLLKRNRRLAVKPNSGTSGGKGFMKLEYASGSIMVNGEEINQTEFEQIKTGLKNYIVTAYSDQHPILRKVWDKSECTLRVIMCKYPGEHYFDEPRWHCAVSYARFGTSVGGGASNLSSGGIGIPFDFETGNVADWGIRYKTFTPDGQWRVTHHPDTGRAIASIRLPNWQYARKKIDAICRQVASLDYLGLDIILTEDGMKLCEINSLPSMDYEQVICGPALTNPPVRRFFENKGLNRLKAEDLREIYQQSREKE